MHEARTVTHRGLPNGRVATVLIADDSKTTQMLVRRALQQIGNIELVCAENGREALEVLKARPVDLLVTDVIMPEMDGIALVREVRRTRAKHELPILMITARAEVNARNEGLGLGANSYVLKPLSGIELRQQAERLLHRRS